MLKVGKSGKGCKENLLYYSCHFSVSFKLFQNTLTLEGKCVGGEVTQKRGSFYLQIFALRQVAASYLSSLITSTKWASVFSRMFLNLSGRRADWSKLTPVHLPFSCKISHREVWLLVSFSSGGGLSSPFCVLELGPPEACVRIRGWGQTQRLRREMQQHYPP